MRKRASLSLSVNAIVVIVIAFVVMGLALTLTNTIFKGSQGKLTEAFDVIDIGKEASAENPITVPGELNIERNKRFTLDFQFYNTNEIVARDVVFNISSCKNADNGELIAPANLPVMVSSIATEIGPSDVKGFKGSITSSNLAAGLYICTVEATNGTTTFEDKNVFINVVT